MKIIRVFPRRTSMTPLDADVRINSEADDNEEFQKWILNERKNKNESM